MAVAGGVLAVFSAAERCSLAVFPVVKRCVPRGVNALVCAALWLPGPGLRYFGLGALVGHEEA